MGRGWPSPIPALWYPVPWLQIVIAAITVFLRSIIKQARLGSPEFVSIWGCCLLTVRPTINKSVYYDYLYVLFPEVIIWKVIYEHMMLYIYMYVVNFIMLFFSASDFEFTMTRGYNRIEYGSAGDCYSAERCPQGAFSINLSDSGFKISTVTRWKLSGSRIAYQQIHISQVLYIKCVPAH